MNTNFGYTFGRTEKSRNNEFDELVKRLEQAPPSKKPAKKGNPLNIPANINSTADYWNIEGVNYKNKFYSVQLAKSLLDNGNAKTQAQWAEYSVLAKQNGSFYTGDMPLYHAVFTSLFKQKDNSKSKKEIEEARAFIQKQMREKYLMTLTRIPYQPIGKDKIIHNYRTNEEYELNEDIVGPDREIITGDKKALTAILGTDDIDEIKSVYKWINQTPAWIWRVNSKPKNINERVAWFVAGTGRAVLNCDRVPDYSDASLGVRVVVRPKGDAKNSAGQGGLI